MEQTTPESPENAAAAADAPKGQHGLYCTQCGAYNAAGSRFCMACGHPLSTSANAAAGQQVDATPAGEQGAIRIPFPDAAERHLHITVGACRVVIRPGSGSDWVAGTYVDPTGSLPCRITQDGGLARIVQEPQFRNLHSWGRGVPTFDLALGTAQPYALTIETGASDTTFDLGGLPLTRLTLKLGAGKNMTRFLEPNPQPLSVLDLDAGAGSMELRGLANSNFAAMTLDGGAAAFICDFGGTLQRPAVVHISTGLAAVEVLVPATCAARIMPESTLGHVDAGQGFTLREGGYLTAAAVAGSEPSLTIHANVALGSLRLAII